MMMVKMIFPVTFWAFWFVLRFFFVVRTFAAKKQPRGNFRLAGLLRLPLIGIILAQKTALHNTPLAFSPIFRKILHERPETFITIQKTCPSGSISGVICLTHSAGTPRMRLARPPAAAAEVFHKRGPRLGRARRNAGLRTIFVVFCRLFSRFQQKFVYFFV